MNKVKLSEILNDDAKLAEFIDDLEQESNNTEETKEIVDNMLKSIMELTDNFKDRRALKASLISATNELLTLKQQITNDKIKNTKTMLDVMTKKKEMEIKAQQATATEAIASGVNNSLQAIFNRLDSQQIHPIKLTDEEIQTECIKIIDNNETENVKKDVKTIDQSKPKLSVSDIQNQLDGADISGEEKD